MEFISKFFKLKEHNTTFRVEVLAGLTTFMTMAYIIFVNPSLLSVTGMDFGAVMTATIISAAFSTILMGIFTNYPFALASGMGLNAFFAFTVAAQRGWESALGAVFISGVLFMILAVTGVITKIDKAIPRVLKKAIAGGIGLFIALIGLVNAGIIVSNPATIVGIGDLAAPATTLAILGLVIISILMALKVRGSILIGIILTTIIGMFMGVTAIPTGIGDIIGTPHSLAPILFKMDLAGALQLGVFTIFSFAFVDIFDTLGTAMGTATKAGFLDKEGNLPKIKNLMIVDAFGTMFGATVGTSTVTTYVESASGISEGGRTGLTAVSTGVFFLLALFLAPLALLVPSAATAPALIIVGVLMVESIMGIDFGDFTEALPAFLVLICMPFMYSIADGIAVGFISYPIVKLVAGKKEQVHWLMYVLAAIALIHFIM